jgi:hypothetical protein
MTEEKNDMFSGESKKPDNKKLLEYLNGSLSETERTHFEDQVPADPFLQDAVEGLNAIEDKDGLPKVVSHLNQQLHHHLSNKKFRRDKKNAPFEKWIYWSILIVLLLAIVGFLVLRFMLKK